MTDDEPDLLEDAEEERVTLEHVHLGERRTVERGSAEHRALLRERNAARIQLWKELIDA